MKRAIITPTYKGHFAFAERYLESCVKYIEDRLDITFVFTISSSEKKDFDELVKPYIKDLKIEVLFFEELLKKYDVKYTPDELLFKYGKYSYQTLKKFYTLLDVEFDQMLVLDTESMFVRTTNVTELFDEYYKHPFVSYSNVNDLMLVSQFKIDLITNINFALGLDGRNWFLENFVWFYEKQIIEDLAEEYGSPMDIVDRIYQHATTYHMDPSCFEVNLFQGYIFKNAQRYNYEVINVSEQLNKYLGVKEFDRYMREYRTTYNGECGVAERMMDFLSEENVESLADMCHDLRYRIIRCEYSSFENIELQKKFMGIAKPNILAASQRHLFGCNDNRKLRFRYLVFDNNKNFALVKFWAKIFLRPFWNFKKWIVSIPHGAYRVLIFFYSVIKKLGMIF